MASRPASRASILKLPDELLHRIVELSATRPERDQADPAFRFRSAAPALALVCRRLNLLTTPVLYSDLTIHIGSYECRAAEGEGECEVDDACQSTATKLLHQTLKSNPLLWPWCRKLTVHDDSLFSAISSDISTDVVALDLVVCLTSVRVLDLQASHSRAAPGFWAFARLALKHMPGLRELSVQATTSRDTLSLTHACGLFDETTHAHLKTLSLSGIAGGGGREAAKQLSRVAGTGTFTDLKLGAFFSTPDALCEMLKWPAKLESLTFRFAHKTHYMGMAAFKNWGLDTLHPILFRHKETLRCLRISHLTRGGLDHFDLSEFTGLETLTLTVALTGTAHLHLANLAAPRLRSFCWDLTQADQACSEDVGDFQQREEDWIRALVDMFSARSVPCGLIRILCTPRPVLYLQSCADTDDLRFPWDRLDGIAHDLRPRGIVLAYNQPNVTRRAFANILRVVKENQDKPMPSPDYGSYERTRRDGHSTAGGHSRAQEDDGSGEPAGTALAITQPADPWR